MIKLWKFEIRRTLKPGRMLILLCGLSLLFQTPISVASGLQNLKVESMSTPLGLDVEQPRFTWQMSDSSERAVKQTAYRITVHDGANAVWDSGMVRNDQSLNVAYAGATLRPTTRYQWTVTIWDTKGRTSSAQSWFETGLMNPDPKLTAWSGATWIGGSDAELPLRADYLSVYDLSFSIAIAPGSDRGAIVFAANDPRLMNRNRNIFGLENERDASYFKVELDIGPLSSNSREPARLNVYRAGYQATDNPTIPIKSFRIERRFINSGSKHALHRIAIRSEFGALTIRLDGSDVFFEAEAANSNASLATVIANPAGTGDVVTYGLLGDIGFSMDAHQSASFSDLVVSNVRSPGNVLFRENLQQPRYQGIYRRYADERNSGLRVEKGTYRVTGGDRGAMWLADPSQNSMPMLRTAFNVQNKSIKAARLYATARGVYELYLNGKRVGDDYYNPGFTQYNVTQFYQTYDVTAQVAAGNNALGAMLGEGWWAGLLGYMPMWNHYGDRPSLLAKLIISYEDGSSDVVTSNDTNWKYFNAGPVVYSSFYMGEVYDATREQAIAEWSSSSYDDRAWRPATKIQLARTAGHASWSDLKGDATDLSFDQLAITGQMGGTAHVYQTLSAKSVKEVRKGVFVYDMGQNIVGVPRVTFKQGKRGQTITLRVAEILYPDLPESGTNVGMIMTENYRAALSQDTYIMKDGPQVFQPHFTLHGYQYLEITGVDAPPAISDVQALAMSSIHALTAHYESSNPKVNQLWSNITWSNIDNFLSVPTDCPQRNERLGWSGDISVFSRTATFLSDAGPFLRRHLRALRDTQHPSGRFPDVAPFGGGMGGVLWGSAGMTVAWESYLQYGDIAMLREHYPAMVAYIEYLETTIDPRTGLSTDIELGDWLSPQYKQQGSALLATAYHVHDLDIAQRTAELLGNTKDAARFRKLHEKRKDFFNRTFVSADKKTLGYLPIAQTGPSNGTSELAYRLADTQSSYAVGLALGAFNDENIPHMQRNLAAAVQRENVDDRGVKRPAYSLMTGFIGTAWINDALSQAGRTDLAYKLLQNNQYPSWLYPVEQGATTIWERLNSYTKDEGFGGNNSMNSFNHYAFGAVGQWMMAYSLGIQRDQPGFKTFVLQPHPDPTGEMTSASGYYDSPYGRIESSWRTDGAKLSYTAVVPPNTQATLYLPARSQQDVKESGMDVKRSAGLKFKRYEDGKAVFEVGSGTYRFTTTY